MGVVGPGSRRAGLLAAGFVQGGAWLATRTRYEIVLESGRRYDDDDRYGHFWRHHWIPWIKTQMTGYDMYVMAADIHMYRSTEGAMTLSDKCQEEGSQKDTFRLPIMTRRIHGLMNNLRVPRKTVSWCGALAIELRITSLGLDRPPCNVLNHVVLSASLSSEKAKRASVKAPKHRSRQCTSTPCTHFGGTSRSTLKRTGLHVDRDIRSGKGSEPLILPSHVSLSNKGIVQLNDEEAASLKQKQNNPFMKP
ncbi:MAG: hypothetical protein ALECFALPRED_007653 [Alectoria fallacina]|uniref:Uncharacterized protein n=1 Tax=Alectoria fallacina TaxID=1903189 RepID=A0A8H3IFJ0_9LECA|nr:MAG: hypothetical protein ALECFALPRED_007653 [Alectoria fallacina]